MGRHTRETPYVSHFARERGNTGKSTARIATTVMSIICALYVVKAGNGRIHVRDSCLGVETVGDAGWLEGKESPLSRCGMRRGKPVGIRIKRDRMTSRSAKSVIDRRGTTRRTHERPKFTGRFVGKRVHRAA